MAVWLSEMEKVVKLAQDSKEFLFKFRTTGLRDERFCDEAVANVGK